MQFTGLKDFLESKKPNEQVKKSEIEDFMRDNRIEVVEVVKGERSDFTEKDIVDVKIDQLGSGSWVVKTKENGTVEFPLDKADDKNEAIQYALDQLNYDNVQKRSDKPKFSQYQLEGEKENYKEVLVTMPSKKVSEYSIKERPSPRGVGVMYDVVHNKTNRVVSSHRDAAEAMDNLKQYNKNIVEDKQMNFKSGHFDEPNILVHLRMNTRTDAEGNKVLFLEEVQSDWGQKGKREGFKSADKDAELKRLQEEAGMATFDFNQIEEELDRQYEEKKKDGESRSELRKRDSDFNKLAQQYIPAEQKMLEARRAFDLFQVENRSEIPTAPFVTDTNAWAKLGLKVALKEAVAQGAERIAWTTGEQQNERYDLSKQINRIYGENNGDGTYMFHVLDKNNSSIVNYKATDLKTIENTVGKEFAEKISKEKGVYDYQGLDLKVGGRYGHS